MPRKKITKYSTGDSVPEEAVYINTVTQTMRQNSYTGEWENCFYVNHYFLEEVEEDEPGR